MSRIKHFGDGPGGLESILADAFEAAGVAYSHEGEAGTEANINKIDFHLTALNVFVEVKRYPTDRTTRQIEAHSDIILIQGEAAARAFARHYRFDKPTNHPQWLWAWITLTQSTPLRRFATIFCGFGRKRPKISRWHPSPSRRRSWIGYTTSKAARRIRVKRSLGHAAALETALDAQSPVSPKR